MERKEKLMAYFHPQAWVNNCAIEIDGGYEFDVTDQIFAMTREDALKICNASDAADALWLNNPVSKERPHDGPFLIEVEDEIRAWFGEV